MDKTDKMKEALYYKKLDAKKVRCLLCPVGCVLDDGKFGVCGLRKNYGGVLIAESYGNLVSIAMDPIEKKPLYHFYPGSQILSVAFNGCNLGCIFCQNWSISQMPEQTEYVSPEELIDIAKKYRSIGVCFTYTEPLMGYEYVLDVAKLAKREGLKIVLVTNAYLNLEPLENLLPYVDAMNIDLKSMKDDFYRKICKGRLQPVIDAIRLSCKYALVELTNLVIPSLNDTTEELETLTDFVASVSEYVPLHFSRFFPHYKLKNIPITPEETLILAHRIARKKLHYVYIGNIDIPGTSNTYCPGCGTTLIERHFYTVRIKGITDGKCVKCGRKVDVVGV